MLTCRSTYLFTSARLKNFNCIFFCRSFRFSFGWNYNLNYLIAPARIYVGIEQCIFCDVPNSYDGAHARTYMFVVWRVCAVWCWCDSVEKKYALVTRSEFSIVFFSVFMFYFYLKVETFWNIGIFWSILLLTFSDISFDFHFCTAYWRPHKNGIETIF